MKWSEFKKLVDKELKGKDPEIDYIDISYPDTKYNVSTPNVYIDSSDNSMAIS